ncbi:MAG: S-methyl-5'-thioinosine phosphorylase [Gammaproteobacteria bacterium]|jgi:purine nucleoside phosphorylase
MPTSNQPEVLRLAVIGGSGLYRLGLGPVIATHQIATPWAAQPVCVIEEQTAAGNVLFLPRHGEHHTLAPHRINYRANVGALQTLGATHVIAINAVGGISPGMIPGRLVLPDQVIDYSYGRDHTFFTEQHSLAHHIDFTNPFDLQLRERLAASIKLARMEYRIGGVYGCTQGPRLETAAEIRRLYRDGCDIVGMTGMPEAALARELGLRYAMLALVVNRAAGMGVGDITLDDIKAVLQQGVDGIRVVLGHCSTLLLAR